MATRSDSKPCAPASNKRSPNSASAASLHWKISVSSKNRAKSCWLRCAPLRFDELDLAALRGPYSLSETDLRTALHLDSAANRVLTVENETTFLELAKSNRDTLLIQTSYPNRAVLALLSRLPAELPVFHFGDTDPAGFDILRDLRARTARPIQPMHMAYRPRPDSPTLSTEEKNQLTRLLADPMMADCGEPLEAMRKAGTKGEFEQESLGPPELEGWPFYGLPMV